MRLHQATADPRGLQAAGELLDFALAHFGADGGPFYDTGDDAEVLVRRPQDPTDNAAPSGSSALANALLAHGAIKFRAGDDGFGIDKAAEAEAVLSIACGAGIQSLAERLPGKAVFPGLNTMFIGETAGSGLWQERCQGCGNCVLGITGGLCPVTRCAKGLLNGPCGGMEDGRCEADRELDCAWHLIYERLKKQGRRGVFTRTVPPKNWGTVRKPGRLKLG